MTNAAHIFEGEAARSLADALAQASTLHQPGQRERHRRRLARAIDQANLVLAAAEEERGAADGATNVGARATLAKAHAAWAQDALHGARQLSLSAQRAPTREACDEGWLSVEAIVAGAEASARACAAMATALDEAAPRPAVARAARKAAVAADVAARAARRIVDERNHAYTFHTDSAFSFGEGWYLAAAAVLEGVAIQIEPDKPGTAQADRFLRDAGLASQLQPYRSRPRANKQTTDIVARAFAADPSSAQRKLRAAFLGDAPIAQSVTDWIDARFAAARDARKVLVWVRDAMHHPRRNTMFEELVALSERARCAGLVPVLIGDALREGRVPEGAIDLIHFWKDAAFQQADTRRAQLQLFEHMKNAHGVVGQLGVTTAGMDGPALMGLATIYLTDATNNRMGAWVGRVPGYREVVRGSGYLDRISALMSEWATPPRRLTPA
jgi:hypothetical protein